MMAGINYESNGIVLVPVKSGTGRRWRTRVLGGDVILSTEVVKGALTAVGSDS